MPDPPSRVDDPEPTSAPTADRAPGPNAAAAEGVTIVDATDLNTAQADAAPTRLTYERWAIDMPVFPVGVAADGQMEIPENPYDAGWYRYGPGPGSGRGSVLIAAHVGSETVPRGPFHALTSAQEGDLIDVEDAGGATTQYRVASVTSEAKTRIDLDEHFVRDGPEQLILITCGGRWDTQRLSFEDNVVLVATVVE